MVEGRIGVVRAESRARASEVSALAESLVPRVRALLPHTRECRVEVWVVDDLTTGTGSLYPQHVAAVSDHATGRITVRNNDDRLELHLVHELVHVLIDDTWDPLPGILEEGLCDYTAAQLVPEDGREHHVRRLLEAASFCGGLDTIVEVDGASARAMREHQIAAHVRVLIEKTPELPLLGALELDDAGVFERATGDDGTQVYGLGYLVAASVVAHGGFAKLHELCEAATKQGDKLISPAALLIAAGLENDDASVRRAISSLVPESDLPLLAELLADQLAEATVELGRDEYPSLDATHFLRNAHPAFRMSPKAPLYPLSRTREFRAAIVRRWGSI